MPFLNEILALDVAPANIQFVPPGIAPTRSVSDRITTLAGASDAYKAFLEAFSSFLQPPHTLFVAGLSSIELRMRQEVLSRAGRAAFGDLVTLDAIEGALLEIKSDRSDETGRLVNGLLSKVLTGIENAFMFPPGADRARAVTLTGFVDPADFRTKLIKAGRTWKDPSVPWQHGEFTHRLQWCAGMLALPGPIPWRQYFIETGQYADDAPFGAVMINGLWDALADRNQFEGVYNTPYLTMTADDFRSPENLHAWLVDKYLDPDWDHIRLLSTFIFARQTRREIDKNNGIAYAYATTDFPPARRTWDAWSRVLFNNRNEGALSPAEKAVLARAWYRLTKLVGGDPVNAILEISPDDVAIPAPGIYVPDRLLLAHLDLELNGDGSSP